MSATAEHPPLRAPVQVVLAPGQSLSERQPLQRPARHFVLPPQSESFVDVFRQVPETPPAQVCDLPQSLDCAQVDGAQTPAVQTPLPQCEFLVH